jgi:hypothetical protein
MAELCCSTLCYEANRLNVCIASRVVFGNNFQIMTIAYVEMDGEIFRVYFREIELGELYVTELRFRSVKTLA